MTSPTGIETANLEVVTPGGEYIRFGDLLAEPEQFAGASLEKVEKWQATYNF